MKKKIVCGTLAAVLAASMLFGCSGSSAASSGAE